MPEPAEHHVFFAVVGFEVHPREISLIAGIEPDDAWIAGESFTDILPEARRRENRWILASGLDRHASHEDHFRRLLYKLKPMREALPRLQEHYRCGVGVSRFFFMDHPEFYLPEDLIEEFRALDLDVGFDQLAIGAGPAFPEVSSDILDLPDEEDEL